MVTMKKGNRVKIVDESEVKGQLKNGWAVDANPEIKAVLRPVKKNAEETPAVEDSSSEQGDDDKANLEENENE